MGEHDVNDLAQKVQILTVVGQRQNPHSVR